MLFTDEQQMEMSFCRLLMKSLSRAFNHFDAVNPRPVVIMGMTSLMIQSCCNMLAQNYILNTFLSSLLYSDNATIHHSQRVVDAINASDALEVVGRK